MRATLPALLASALALPAVAASDDAWQAFREDVRAACLALAGDGAAKVEVNPYGSETYGVAIVTVAVASGEERHVCIYDKAAGTAELTAPFAPGG